MGITRANYRIHCAYCGKVTAKKVEGGFKCHKCRLFWSVEDLALSKEERSKLIRAKQKELAAQDKKDEQQNS